MFKNKAKPRILTSFEVSRNRGKNTDCLKLLLKRTSILGKNPVQKWQNSAVIYLRFLNTYVFLLFFPYELLSLRMLFPVLKQKGLPNEGLVIRSSSLSATRSLSSSGSPATAPLSAVLRASLSPVLIKSGLKKNL